MRIIVGVTGASGVEMAYFLLKGLRGAVHCSDGTDEAGKPVPVETHLVVSRGAGRTWREEKVPYPLEELYALADAVYSEDDFGARICSGSFVTAGMIVMPCSMKTLAGIASGYADNLIQRSADVCIKERRTLVLVPREMPVSLIHLENMARCASCGAVIVPPMLTFYSGQRTLEDEIWHVIGKVLLPFGLSVPQFHAWKEES